MRRITAFHGRLRKPAYPFRNHDELAPDGPPDAASRHRPRRRAIHDFLAANGKVADGPSARAMTLKSQSYRHLALSINLVENRTPPKSQ
jgi:hypothetical protein